MPTTHSPKSTADKGKAMANTLSHTQAGSGGASFADARPEAQAQNNLAAIMSNSAQMQQLDAVQRIANGSNAPIQRMQNPPAAGGGGGGGAAGGGGGGSGAPHNPSGAAMTSLGNTNTSTQQPTGGAAPAAKTPAGGAGAAGTKTPAYTVRTPAEIKAKLLAEAEKFGMSDPEPKSFNTGYNGRGGANEVMHAADIAALKADWEKAGSPYAIWFTGGTLEAAYSSQMGTLLPKNRMFDFKVEKQVTYGNGANANTVTKAVFNFHMEVA